MAICHAIVYRFHTIKQLLVFLLPLGGYASHLQGYPQFQ